MIIQALKALCTKRSTQTKSLLDMLLGQQSRAPKWLQDHPAQHYAFHMKLSAGQAQAICTSIVLHCWQLAVCIEAVACMAGVQAQGLYSFKSCAEAIMPNL